VSGWIRSFLYSAYRLPLIVPNSTLTPVHVSASPPNILAVRFSSIGDVLLTTPLLRAIRRRHPAARLTVLTKEPYLPLLSHNPQVTRVIGLSGDRKLTDLAAELRSQRYTHLLDLHDSLRSRMLRVLVPGKWTTYRKHRLARTILIHTKRNVYHDRRQVAERYFSAARALDLAPDGAPPELFWPADIERSVTDWLSRAGVPEHARIIALAPGAAHATKRWPLEHWRALIRGLGGPAGPLILVGGPEDAPLATQLAGVAPGQVLTAAGQFGLLQTAALLRRASVLVSGDTGVMHMATAVGTPVVALFGPTVQAFGFFPYTSRARVLELALDCRPCTSKGGPQCPLGHHRCLQDLSPEAVYQAVSGSMA
jgi:lipopolysaccharide heptosyltransferase II